MKYSKPFDTSTPWVEARGTLSGALSIAIGSLTLKGIKIFAELHSKKQQRIVCYQCWKHHTRKSKGVCEKPESSSRQSITPQFGILTLERSGREGLP